MPAKPFVIEEFIEGEKSHSWSQRWRTLAPLVPAQDHKRVGAVTLGPIPAAWVLTRRTRFSIPLCAIAADAYRPARHRRHESRERRLSWRPLLRAQMTLAAPRYSNLIAASAIRRRSHTLRLENDIVAHSKTRHGRPPQRRRFLWTSDATLVFVATSGGYPGAFEVGKRILGLDGRCQIAGVKIVHAGTALVDGQTVTAGGRVLGVAATGPTLDAALDTCYAAIGMIQFDGMYYRTDIGRRTAAK